MKVLLGNTFPLALVRRRVLIEPISIEDAKARLEAGFVSFWGHANTAAVAQAQLGFDVRPKTGRPALKLNEEQLPTLDGETFTHVVILSPNYRPGFRPAPTVEPTNDDIVGWEPLLLTFPE